MSGVRRSSRSGGSGTAGSCVSAGRHRHPFVQGEAAADPPEWTAAEPPDGGRRAAGTGGGSLGGIGDSAAAGVLSLQVGTRSFFWAVCGALTTTVTRKGRPASCYPTDCP